MTRYTFSLLFDSLDLYMAAKSYIVTVEARSEFFARLEANYGLPVGISCDTLIEAVPPV